ncbi:epithelial cell-transforming sequence 2 oncogene-like isoform X2 [Osmerus eperlanus]|uniref:epithelial cell-transforming sequence 2 oncogene-like isoform X2 n=1 Tax=Osmerus eperlanus TaxID=29151 RepID=UPI002E0D1B44
METSHSVKRWELDGTDYDTQFALTPWSKSVGAADTRFSAWTPITNKSSNKQLFEERTSLILHWFDLWTDRQRRHLLTTLLTRCSKSQLEFCRDWLKQTVPATSVDFTTILPQCLSLYVMSFLSPRDLGSAAQVSWHWRFLAEQDCLWAGRSIRLGWFLPYTPGEKEYGGWKSHYISCVATLDWLTPREAAEQYGTLNQPSAGTREEEEERWRERMIRQTIRERVEELKKASLKNRRIWGSNIHAGGRRSGRAQAERLRPGVTFSPLPSLSWPPETRAYVPLNPKLNPNLSTETTLSLQPVRVSKGSLSCYTSRTRTPQQPSSSPHGSLLLLSNRVPAYELVLSGVRGGVIPVLYDHRGTLPALLAQVKRALGGHRIQRLGLLAPGGTDELILLQGYSVTERSVLSPDIREFWEKLCGWVLPLEEGGGVDIFSPLAASASGVILIQTLSTLTGLEVQAPMGIATGFFQNILSEWSGSGGVSVGARSPSLSPPARYVSESVLQGWARQALWLEQALGALRDQLEPQLQQLSLDTRGRALGQFLWDVVALEQLSVSKELSVVLVEALTALSTQDTTRPMEFLSLFLRRRGEETEIGDGKEQEEMSEGISPEKGQYGVPCPNLDIPQAELDWRAVVFRELYHSERQYLSKLGAVLSVYHDPLDSALNSNRAILSSAHIHMILTPVKHILEVNRLFLSDLGARQEKWGAEQCVGDACVKFCSRLRVYTNYLNNYPTALRTIDKCREMIPSFRAFLKRVDRTLASHMLSLQELLLCPVWRVEEYITLLKAFTFHTPPEHPDHTHLSSALHTLLRYRDFIHKLKKSSERDVSIQETQRRIKACPNLCEGNRQLITTQDAILLRSPHNDIADSLKTYEQVADVGLFLFTDALVLTERSVRHTPFSLSQHSTHTFLASVALPSLNLREVTHTRYVCNAFVLEGPCRVWVCSTEREEERERFLLALSSARLTALAEG